MRSPLLAHRTRHTGRLGRVTAAAAVAAVGLLVVACGGETTTDGALEDPANDPAGEEAGEEATAEVDDDRPSTNLRVSYPQEPPNWDYTENTATANRALLVHNVVEPLLERQEDGSWAPLLADVTVSEDGLTYVLELVDATFHDGTALTSADVVYSLEYNRASPHAVVSVPFDAVAAIEPDGERTVTVTLDQPSQRFLEGLSGVSGLIIAEGSSGDLATQPVGTGPYTFDEWRPDVSVSLRRFEDYWAELPYFESIDYRFIGDETAALNALRAGDIDLVGAIVGDGVEQFDSIDATEGLVGLTSPSTNIHYLTLNAEDPVFDDARVRQAIAHAIDREPILLGGFGGRGEANCVFVNPPNVPWNSDYCPYPHDPDRARELLADAGREDLELTLKFPQVADFPPIAEIEIAQLAAVGISVESQGRDLPTFLDEVLADFDYQLATISGAPQIDAWVGEGRMTRDALPEFDALLAEADAATDVDEWAELRREAVELHADRAYLIPLGNKDDIFAARDDLAGIKPFRAAQEVDFRRLRWAD